MSKFIELVVGARPNFMKAAPIIWAADRAGVETKLIHTGQHYDTGMSQLFFDELGIPKPHRHLGVGSGTHGEVTGRCLEWIEKALMEDRPEWVLVVGDVNSTMAGALAAVKLRIPTAHVEAGLRSFDREMPEEINRVVTDAICDLLFVSEPSGVKNLRREGRCDKDIRLVGNVMIDTLERFLPTARDQHTNERFGLSEDSYALVTLHRPSNVDASDDLDRLIDCLEGVLQYLPVIFPIHPRTKVRMSDGGKLKVLERLDDLHITEPLGYLDFLSLMASARVVLTDSGGIQEETTVLGVPCLTLRDNTERPITIEQGTNRLVGAHGEHLLAELDEVISGRVVRGRRPDLWDGKAAERILYEIIEHNSTGK